MDAADEHLRRDSAPVDVAHPATSGESASLLPPAPAGAIQLLHDRELEIRARQVAHGRLIVSGTHREVASSPSPSSLRTVHRVGITVEVEQSTCTIITASTDFETHPPGCRCISDHDEGLAGTLIDDDFLSRATALYSTSLGCELAAELVRQIAAVVFEPGGTPGTNRETPT